MKAMRGHEETAVPANEVRTLDLAAASGGR